MTASNASHLAIQSPMTSMNGAPTSIVSRSQKTFSRPNRPRSAAISLSVASGTSSRR
jgi:hypothetical protein